jgi:hypothetical protein
MDLRIMLLFRTLNVRIPVKVETSPEPSGYLFVIPYNLSPPFI